MCYDNAEVKTMEQEYPQDLPQEPPVHVPRPRWQVWGARVALAVFVVVLILYYINISRGGL